MSIKWESLFADRAARMHASDIREILKITAMPDVISLAGGLPAPEVFPIDEFRQAFDLAYGKILVNRTLRKRLGVVAAHQRPRMAHVEPAGLEMIEHRLRQRQQALQIGDVAARFADKVGDRRLRQVIELAEPLVSARLLDRVQVLALDVFDQCKGQHVALLELAN